MQIMFHQRNTCTFTQHSLHIDEYSTTFAWQHPLPDEPLLLSVNASVVLYTFCKNMDESIHIWTMEAIGELDALLRPG